MVTGGPGAGKTTLWEAGIRAAEEHGLRVLRARPSGADAELSFAGLIDLLDGVELRDLGLPSPQRSALEVALLRAEPSDAPPEAHAIRLALLNALRELARLEPLIVAVDDLQWLDAPSGDSLAFAAGRLDAAPVAFLLARRPGAPTSLERALEGRTVTLTVGPLSLGAIRRLLSERLGLSLQRQHLRRVVETTLGNPLFALEIGRSFVELGVPPAADDIAVPEVVEDLLGTRVAGLPRRLSRLLLAVALSGDLRVSQLAEMCGDLAVDDAVDTGLLVVEGDRVRPSHPLLAAAARSRARAREQRAMHLELARVLADSELHALHLALAADGPDPELAATLTSAAAAAGARGAAQDAVVLAGHALRVTAAGAPEWSDRVLQLARYIEVAGDLKRLSAFLADELDSLPPGRARAQALVLLSEGGAIEHNDESLDYLQCALVESAEDPLLHASIAAQLASNWAAIGVERIEEAEARAEAAVHAARSAGDAELERFALTSLSWPRCLRGQPIDDICRRFVEVSDAVFYLAGSPERIAAERLVWRGEVEHARATLTRLRAVADERGEPVSYALVRLHRCELELRAGGWDAAARLLDEWADTSDDELLGWPMYERCRAFLAVGRGAPDEAEHWIALTLERSLAMGARWEELEARRGAGIVALLAGDPEAAVDGLRAVWEHTVRERVDEPGAFPVATDLVETLVELAALDEAAAVNDRLRLLAKRHDHPWASASARRCAAAIALAAAPYDERAASELEAAADDYARFGLEFDRARSLLSLGRAQRRMRKWGAARRSLELAASLFDRLGSPGWADQARSELARVGARKPQPTGGLTPAERRVAELAAEGLANKEIALALHVTINTVEAHLSHVYAKLGVRSRAQLSRFL